MILLVVCCVVQKTISDVWRFPTCLCLALNGLNTYDVHLIRTPVDVFISIIKRTTRLTDRGEDKDDEGQHFFQRVHDVQQFNITDDYKIAEETQIT